MKTRYKHKKSNTITRSKHKYRNRTKSNKFNKPKEKTSSKLIKILFIIFLIILLIIQSIPFKKSKMSFQDLQKYQSSVLPEIKAFEKSLNLSINDIQEFRQINRENKLIEENVKFKLSKKPDISVILTIHNQDHILHKGIRSIQNQSLKNIEIIIIDDCSEDDSLEKIKAYQKEDPRIILISHESNEGAIKSRSEGIRIAKGKYITSIDGDDAFAHKDILKNSLFIAQKADLDAVEFPGAVFLGGIITWKVYDYGSSNISRIIYQPELRNKFFFRIGKDLYWVKNRVIWGKLIKNELFQKILKYIGSEYTEDYNNNGEDLIMSLSLQHLAQSYYVMKEIGYYYTFLLGRRKSFTKKKTCKDNCKIKEDFGRFKLTKFLMEKSNNCKKEKLAAFFEITQIVHHYHYTNKTVYKTIVHVYDKLLEWGDLNNKHKNYIISLKNKAVQAMNS